jgi:hypothetical protein
VLRVLLLWVRGDARDASCVEVRTLAEQQIDEDDAGRAEDAVAAMSEVALRADNAHALKREGALGLRRRRTAERRSPAPRRPTEDLPREVGDGWAPEPLTDAGQAQLAHRLLTAEPERWSAAVLEPLLVTGAMDAPQPAPPWPEKRKGPPKVPGIDKPARWIFWISVLTFFTATSYLDDPSVPDGSLAVAVVSAAAAISRRRCPRCSPGGGRAAASAALCAPPHRARRWRSSRASRAPPGCSPSLAAEGGSPSCTSGPPPTTAAAASSRCARSPRARTTTSTP